MEDDGRTFKKTMKAFLVHQPKNDKILHEIIHINVYIIYVYLYINTFFCNIASFFLDW